MKRLASPDDVGEDLVLIGLVGFIDPPREEVKAAVAACKAAGIRVIMITGDHAATAREIARQLNLSADPTVLTGEDIEALDDKALGQAVQDTTVFARTKTERASCRE